MPNFGNRKKQVFQPVVQRGSEYIEFDYKNSKQLQRFMTPDGNILSRAKTGLSAKNQRALSREIKRARYMALLPYTTLV